jgi:fucose permease
LGRHQTTIGLIGYLFIGTAAVLLPSTMPFITAEFVAAGLTLALVGLVFPAREVGSIVGNLLSGLGSDWLGRTRQVWLAALLLAASLILAAGAMFWPLFILSLVVVSAAQSALSNGINALITDANRGSRARALNTLHGVYGVGAAVSPLVIGYLIEQALPWRWILGGAGLIWLVYGLVVYGLHRATQTDTQRQKRPKLDLTMLREPPFLALALIAFVYNGIAVSLLGWIALMMQQTAGFSIFFSVSMISLFYVALTIGRFLCAAFAERLRYATTLLILAVGITLTYPLVLGGNAGLVVVGVFLTGLSLSGLLPTVLAYGTRLYAEQTGAVTGMLSLALTMGSMVPPLWTGVIADRWGFQVALGINYLLVLPLLLSALYLSRVERRQEEPAPLGDRTPAAS